MTASRSEFPSLSDFESVGFVPAEITEFLRCYGVNIEGTPTSAAAVHAATDWPDWKVALAAHERLSTWQAAAALAGIDPHQSSYLTDDDRAEIVRWESALDDSAALTFMMDGDRRFPLTEFADWCDEKGIPYPLPRLAAAVDLATDPELRAALDAARKAASAWEAKAGKLEAENAALKRAAEQAKATAHELKGKGRTSALKIIAGLASMSKMWGSGSDRNQRHGALAEHMKKLGVGVDSKTLTDWLSDAKKEVPIKPPTTD